MAAANKGPSSLLTESHVLHVFWMLAHNGIAWCSWQKGPYIHIKARLIGDNQKYQKLLGSKIPCKVSVRSLSLEIIVPHRFNWPQDDFPTSNRHADESRSRSARKVSRSSMMALAKQYFWKWQPLVREWDLLMKKVIIESVFIGH